jgi:hypothetical protein
MMHLFDWFQKEQQRRRESMNRYEIFLVNQHLQRILQQVENYINKEDYQQEIQEAEQPLIQSGIWNIRYRNNMENEQVALSQAVLIQKILLREDIPNKNYLKEEVERAMRRIGNIHWGIYQTYKMKTR